jgi:hypothetical protein
MTTVRCTGQDFLQGYRAEISDLLALPAFCLFVLFLMMGAKVKSQFAEAIKKLDITVFELASLRISYGMFGVCLALLTLIGFIGTATVSSALRFNAIANYCYFGAAAVSAALERVEGALHVSGILRTPG